MSKSEDKWKTIYFPSVLNSIKYERLWDLKSKYIHMYTWNRSLSFVELELTEGVYVNRGVYDYFLVEEVPLS